MQAVEDPTISSDSRYAYKKSSKVLYVEVVIKSFVDIKLVSKLGSAYSTVGSVSTTFRLKHFSQNSHWLIVM